MGQRFARRKRRRPRRGRRYRGNGLPGRQMSFQSFGLRHFYDLFVPRGRGRRMFFNDVSGAMALGSGVVGAVLGWHIAGTLGVFPGFGVGMWLGAGYLSRSGFFRL
jgi:hypothetical protein